MAIADPGEPKKDGEEKVAAKVIKENGASTSTYRVPKKSKIALKKTTPMRSYSKIKGFSFSIPEGWPDSAIFTFLSCCKENIEELKNHSDDENKWCNIAKSGGEISKRFDCFTVNNCIELGESLKLFVTKYKDRNDNNDDFKQLHLDIRELLPYFPPFETEITKSGRPIRNKSLEKKVEPVLMTTDRHLYELTLENQIIYLGKQYSGLFGVKGSTPAYIWREMSRKVCQKLGIKVDVREHLEAKKRQIASEVLQITDPAERENKFLLLAQDYITYFDYIPPRNIKISDFCLPRKEQQNHLKDDSLIPTDAALKLTKQEGDIVNQNKDVERFDDKTEKHLVVSVTKINVEENILGNEQEQTVEQSIKGKKEPRKKETNLEMLMSDHKGDFVLPIFDNVTKINVEENILGNEQEQTVEPSIKGKKEPRKKKTNLEMLMSDHKGDFVLPIFDSEMDHESQTRKGTLRNKKIAANAYVTLEDKNDELVENGDVDNGLKRRTIARRKIEPNNALLKNSIKDKTEKSPDPVVNEDQIESMENTISKSARHWARGRKRKLTSEETENNEITDEKEATTSEITSPRKISCLPTAKSKIPESPALVKTSTKELVNNNTEDNNEFTARGDLENKINLEQSQESNSSMLKSPKIISSDYVMESDFNKIRKNPYVRLSPLPDSLNELIAKRGEPFTVRIQTLQSSSTKSNQETKKIPSKLTPRAKAKLMEEQVAVPKDVVKNVYNPSSDSAKTKVVTPITASQNMAKRNGTNSKREKSISKPNNGEMMSKEEKTSSKRLNKSNKVFSKVDKSTNKSNISRADRSEASTSRMPSARSNTRRGKEPPKAQAKAKPQSKASSFFPYPNFLADAQAISQLQSSTYCSHSNLLTRAQIIPQIQASSYFNHSNFLADAQVVPQPQSSSCFPNSNVPPNEPPPPKWFQGFTLDYKKHEAWKIGQMLKLQSGLISMEKKKLAALQNILTSLNTE